MGTIIERRTKRGAVRYQVKIRRTGVPILSKVFPSREEAEAWMQTTEPELLARSRQAAREQAQARLIAKFKAQPRIVADLLHRNMQEETVHKKGRRPRPTTSAASCDTRLPVSIWTTLRAATSRNGETKGCRTLHPVPSIEN